MRNNSKNKSFKKKDMNDNFKSENKNFSKFKNSSKSKRNETSFSRNSRDRTNESNKYERRNESFQRQDKDYSKFKRNETSFSRNSRDRTNESNKYERRNISFQGQDKNSLKFKRNETSFFRNSRDRTNESNNFESKEKNIEDYIWGKHSVYEVLKGERPINRIWCTSEIRSSEKFFLLLKEFKNKGTLVEEVPWSRISQITFGAVHQGIALQIAHSKSLTLSELISRANKKKSFPRIVCLDGITDPHNVGAIIRSAEAFGCDGIVLPQRRSAGITGTVAKVAAGALEFIPISRVVNLNRSLQELVDNGFTVVGLSEKGDVDLSSFQSNFPLVIVIGSEDKGLSVLTQKNCDFLLKIPLRGKTSSLNASVAAAISFYQLTVNSLKLNS